MRLIIVFILVGLSFSFDSCKKGKADFTVKGVITDDTMGQPLSGATISFYEIEAGGSGVNLLGSSTTSSDGSYSFTFPRNTVESYNILISKDNYFSLDESILFSGLTIEEDNVRNFSTTAKAWVNLRFINQTPNDPTDVLWYIRTEGKAGCDECCGAGENYLNGLIDTSIICINDGSTNYSYQYSVIGTSDQGTKSVVTTAFDTTELLLSY